MRNTYVYNKIIVILIMQNTMPGKVFYKCSMINILSAYCLYKFYNPIRIKS